MNDLIEKHEPIQDCDCGDCSRYERNRLRGILADIIDPIAAMQRDLPEGYRLDGAMAVHMANDPEHYKRIARAALTPNAEIRGGEAVPLD